MTGNLREKTAALLKGVSELTECCTDFMGVKDCILYEGALRSRSTYDSVGSAVSRLGGTGGNLAASCGSAPLPPEGCGLPGVRTWLSVKLPSAWQCLEFLYPYVKFKYYLSVTVGFWETADSCEMGFLALQKEYFHYFHFPKL